MYDRVAVLKATNLYALMEELLGPGKGYGPSRKWPCPNPNHAQRGISPPVGVFRSDQGFPRWKCWGGCDYRGTAVDLLVYTTGTTVGKALADLARRAGIVSQPHVTPPRVRSAPAAAEFPHQLIEPEGLAEYVEDCAQRLWRPSGRPFREWLMDERGFREVDLRLNRVGADLGSGAHPRPAGVPQLYRPSIVFPALAEDRVVWVQRRFLQADEEHHYSNPRADYAHNPKLTLLRRDDPVPGCVLVTEGPTDGFAALRGGFTAAAIPSMENARDEAVFRLQSIPGALIVAFDNEPLARTRAEAFITRLGRAGRTAVLLPIPQGCKDLNEWMLRCVDWPATLHTAVATVLTGPVLDRAVGL